MGHAGYDRPPCADAHALAVRCLPMLQRLLDARRLRPHPVRLLDGGLDGVVDGLAALAGAGVSGTKLVAAVGGCPDVPEAAPR
ncbi:hypothetical protein CDD83_7351 [Cordyceps sp. RAO-2017]|nr:hypothetical protein CDD83_7351 [Cordyceps sp. RAO-2017]